jgi:hypothetical protein
MSKLRLFRQAENAVPTGAALAGNVYFTEEQNLYVINTAGNKVKFTDVVFTANQSTLGGLAQKYRNKIYVAVAEGTLWHYNGSAWYQLATPAASTQGCTFYLDVVVPVDANGKDGDLYLDGDTRLLYFKQNSVWEAIAKFYNDADVFAAVKNEELLGDANPFDVADSLWQTLNKLYSLGQDALSLAASKAGRPAEIITVTGTSLTIVNGTHVGKWLRFTNAAGCTIEMTAALPDGFQCMLYKDVAGGSIHFSGDANFISPSASIDDEYATVHVLVIGGKVKFKGDFV